MTGLLAVGSLGVFPVGAQESISYPPIVQKLADRFGLNPDEVEEVFEEERANHHAQVLQNFEDRLDEAVSEGKITFEQKEAILDKHEEMQAKMSELLNKGLSPYQMHEEMRAHHEELRAWAEEHDIDIPFMALNVKGPGVGMRVSDKMMIVEKLD